MFIDFPDHDFQFLVTDSSNTDELGTWLTDNGVSPVGAVNASSFLAEYSTRDTYFTVRCRTMYIAINAASDLTIINPYIEGSSEITELTSIMYSILKEVGYYRKGKKDIVINHILKHFKDNIKSAIDDNPTVLLDALVHEEILEARFYNANNNASNVLKIFNFYMSLMALTIKVYCHFKSITVRKLVSPYTVMHTLSHLRLSDNLSVVITSCSVNRIMCEGYDTKNLIELLRRYLRPDRNTNLQIIEDIKTDIIEISTRNNHV